jgi:hypothetical protein
VDRQLLPFYQQLTNELEGSPAAQRAVWAKFIVGKEVPLADLFPLMQNGDKFTQNFLYLMSDIAWTEPDYLLKRLPRLVTFFQNELQTSLPPNFATFWLKCGIPKEMEGLAVDYLFKWLLNAEVTNQRKLHAAEVLTRVQKKYPDLKIELELVLKDLMQNGSPAFQKKINQLLNSL